MHKVVGSQSNPAHAAVMVVHLGCPKRFPPYGFHLPRVWVSGGPSLIKLRDDSLHMYIEVDLSRKLQR